MTDLTVVTPYGASAPSRRVRVGGWLRHLGLDVTLVDYVGTRDNRPRTLGRHPRAVVAAEDRIRRLASAPPARLLVQREASPLSRGGVEARLLAGADHGVYDFDDALQWDTGTGVRRALAKPQKCLAAVSAADVVIAGNPTLATWAEQWSRHVVVIPSCVEMDDYEAKRSYAMHDPPRLLWIGSPSSEPQLDAVTPALLEVARLTGAVLTVVSAGDRSLGALDAIAERVEWSPDVARNAALGADIGIGPLHDGRYERGKCAYKLLQYAASALPVVGTPVGVNRDVLDATGGTAATTAREWIDGLLGWIEASEEVRAAAGRRARAVVEQGWSYAAWSAVWRATVGV